MLLTENTKFPIRGTCRFSYLSFQILKKETFYGIERKLVFLIVEIRVGGTRDDHEELIVILTWSDRDYIS